MNIKLVLKVLGRVERVVAASMALPLACALLYGEDIAPFLWSIAIILCVSLPLSFLPTDSSFFLREGFAAVGLIWLFTGVAGGLPFFFNGGGGFNTIWDCIFEASSGFTTTGATILTDIESLPKGILLWRAFTHWLGGMGVLVLATAVFPSLGARSQYLTRAETPGPMVVKLVPKQAKTSKILYGIYCAMTLAVIALLWGAGMPLYDAAVHAFSIAGTGGFSSRNASFAAYPLPGVDLIVATATLLFSLNFGLFFLALRRRFREIWRSEELRFFLAVVALATVLIAWDLDPVYHQGALESLRYAFFHVTSVISTSGFFTEDYALWPQFSQMVLVLLMFCGSCSSSTGGGIKTSTFFALIQGIKSAATNKTEKAFHYSVPADAFRKAAVITLLALGVVLTGTYLMVILDPGVTLMQALFEVTSAFGTVGLSTGITPGLSDGSKLLSILIMYIGRLGPLTIASLWYFTKGERTHYPEGNIAIG